MADRRAEEASIAPRRSLEAGDDGPVLPPMPKPSGRTRKERPAREKRSRPARIHEVSTSTTSSAAADRQPMTNVAPVPPAAAGPAPRGRRPRQAHLRVTQVDPWSVTKTAFLLSIALGVVTVVAVAIVWAVLGAAGLWDSVNSAVQETIGDSSATPFDIQDYVGFSRVLGFTMIVAVVDIVLFTMIATLGAFLYNLAATLLGGVEVTLAEED